jgi:hypothetical protein
VKYTDAQPVWTRSKIGKILRDRACIGEIFYARQWHPGTQPPIIDRLVWSRVQLLLGEKTSKSHDLTYAGELIRCGHCGRAITGESVIKMGWSRIRRKAANIGNALFEPFSRRRNSRPHNEIVLRHARRRA